MIYSWSTFFFFFFNDTATTEIYTLSLHDALPICRDSRADHITPHRSCPFNSPFTRSHVRRPEPEDERDTFSVRGPGGLNPYAARSEEHTSELQSRQYLVCRLLLEKKKEIR